MKSASTVSSKDSFPSAFLPIFYCPGIHLMTTARLAFAPRVNVTCQNVICQKFKAPTQSLFFPSFLVPQLHQRKGKK
jgi:hypothetical protein